MKCAAYLIAVTMLCGCAAKKPVAPKVKTVITRDCIVGFTKTSKCEPLPPDLAICHDVVMKLACVRVIKETQ